MSSSSVAVERRPWATELVDLVRGASGGFLFGIPLLYTMEVWWAGRLTEPAAMLAVLAVTFTLVFLLNRTAGFRSTRDVLARDALKDTVEAVALGLVLSFGILVLLREIGGDTPLGVGLGKVVYETMPFCIGIGVANHFLRQGRDQTDDSSARGRDSKHSLNATFADMAATLIGSLFIALNIAPTDEIPMLAAAMRPHWLLLMMGASLAISYGIVFIAGFSGEEQRHAQVGVLQHPVTETVVCYLLSLGAAALMLLLFQRLEGPAPDVLTRIIILGLPATVGGAAGRLAT